ncbi:MAG: sigma-70 family RNA polymerase sigma factor [Planctomycetota bacterium]
MWPRTDDTEELLASVRRGDADARDKLFDRHRNAIRRMVDLRMDRVLERRVDASDIVQDTLIEANRRLSDYLADPVMPFHLWLRQMAKDRLIDAHRRHRVAARRSMDREQPLVAATKDEESALDLAGQLSDGQMTPAAAATWHELQRRFKEACEKLEPQDQEIILMRHFERMSNSEVAEALELSAQAASMRHLRAMRRLRVHLEDEQKNLDPDA